MFLEINIECRYAHLKSNITRKKKRLSQFFTIHIAVTTTGCNLQSLKVIGSCVFCAPFDRYIGRLSVDMSTDVSVDISAECRPICRPIYRSTVGRYVDRYMSVGILTDTSVDMSTNTRPICWSICRPRVVVRLSADMSIDRLPTFRRYFTALVA